MKPISDPVHTAANSAENAGVLSYLLVQLGFDSEIIDGMLGDLAEERGRLREEHGALRAQAWYTHEILRSFPYWITAGIRRGDARTRLRIVGSLALVMSLGASALVAYASRAGSPAAIVLSGSDPAEGLVVNYAEPTPLQTHVLDDRGHRLANERVDFRWVSGDPIAISPSGMIDCQANGDAIVRATARGTGVDLAVHCRPVREVLANDWVDFVVGDAPRDIPFVAVGVDGRRVTQLRGTNDVNDTAVVSLEGTTMRPRAAGVADLTLTIGGRARTMRVIVHPLVSSFVNLRADQAHVAIPIRLAHGDTVRFALPRGVYWLKYLPKGADGAPPTITLDGGANCGAGDGLHEYRVPVDAVMRYCVIKYAASVTVAHGTSGLPTVEGALALDRVDEVTGP